MLRYWQTRTHCCGHIVAHDVSLRAQTEKHLLRTQTVSEQNQKHLWCPGHKICVRNKCCACGQTGKHLCRQQCVRNNVSSFASSFTRKQLVSQRCEKYKVVLLSLQLATQQLQLQNGVLHVNFFLQPATQRLLRCKLQEKLPRV